MSLNPTRPNAGLRVAYQRRLEALVDEMHASLEYWLRSAYRREMAVDASAAVELRRAMARLGRRWTRRFDRLAPKLARYFAEGSSKLSDAKFKQEMRAAGFTVRFKATASQNEAFQATISEQVNLIKSIAQEHLADVESILNRSVLAGRDLGSMAKALETTYGVTKRRAAFIARDQNNKATAVFTRVRQQELGITEAIWLHSAAGKTPRASHVAFSGQRYNIAEGALLDGVRTWPGVEINCRCVSKPIIPGFDA